MKGRFLKSRKNALKSNEVAWRFRRKHLMVLRERHNLNHKDKLAELAGIQIVNVVVIKGESKNGALTYPEGFSYRYGRPNSGAQKKEIYFLCTYIFYYGLCFFLLTLSKVYFQISNHTLPIANHSKICKTCSLQGFYRIDDHQHFIIELLVVLQSLQENLLYR